MIHVGERFLVGGCWLTKVDADQVVLVMRQPIRAVSNTTSQRADLRSGPAELDSFTRQLANI